MPEAADHTSAEVRLARVEGTWSEPLPPGEAFARFSDGALEIVWPTQALRVECGEITGARWRGDTLALHSAQGSLTLQGVGGMERAWTALLAMACPLPEFTRGLRALGSRRAGSHESHARFFAPLLQARRRLADEGDLDRRVAAFRAAELRDRFERVVTEIAASVYPHSAPERRSLEAEVRDEVLHLFAALDALGLAAAEFERSAEDVRFTCWHAWVAAVAKVFLEADRAWTGIAKVLPAVHSPPRRGRRWLGAGAILLVAAVQGMLAGGMR